jgi:C4-dicarboxylate-specific signal transduction histidine kinase
MIFWIFPKLNPASWSFCPRPYQVSSMVNDVVAINLVRIGNKPIKLVFDIDENIPAQLFGDELRVRQALNNFLSNAFKYTLEGEVKLSMRGEQLSDTGAFCLVCVISDTGIGIRPGIRPGFLRITTRRTRKATAILKGPVWGLPSAAALSI